MHDVIRHHHDDGGAVSLQLQSASKSVSHGPGTVSHPIRLVHSHSERGSQHKGNNGREGHTCGRPMRKSLCLLAVSMLVLKSPNMRQHNNSCFVLFYHWL